MQTEMNTAVCEQTLQHDVVLKMCAFSDLVIKSVNKVQPL